MNERQRRRYFVDSKVQGTIVARVVTYWLSCVIAIFVFLFLMPLIVSSLALQSPPTAGQMFAETWRNLWPSFLACFMVLPFIIGDSIRLSNRFVGPLYRVRSAMKKLADGEKVEPVLFRDDDFWFEFAEDFNRALERFGQVRTTSSETPDETESEFDEADRSTSDAGETVSA